MTLRFSLWLYRLLRPRRLRRAIRRYERHLQALARVTVPRLRADKLDLMALLAETISGYEVREPRAQAWGTTADMLRAVAASERFTVLTDPYPHDDDVLVLNSPGLRQRWEALADAGFRGDRRERAEILRELCGAGTRRELAGVLVLDDIAETEEAAAKLDDQNRRRNAQKVLGHAGRRGPVVVVEDQVQALLRPRSDRLTGR